VIIIPASIVEQPSSKSDIISAWGKAVIPAMFLHFLMSVASQPDYD
jgi:hypothetical protein